MIPSPLRIDRAKFNGWHVTVEIEGFDFSIGGKYRFIERGLAVMCPTDLSAHCFLKVNWPRFLSSIYMVDSEGEEVGRPLTDNPVLVALAYQSWWTLNSRPYLVKGWVAIPTVEEAENIIRHRSDEATCVRL